ncbi:MAG: P1 family peptidase [Bacteroidales bacterium]|jgi:D-aminopeptidase|nr:P1 family peptidase [Bacteroidales bacterium]
MKRRLTAITILIVLTAAVAPGQALRPRDYGISIGILTPGIHNAITDVPGVKVGHVTIIRGDSVNTGVTAVLPHGGNIFQGKVPAAIFVANGFGKLAGITQVNELGNIETPVILTNTLSIAAGLEGLIDYTLSFPENRNVRSVNGIVGETNDGGLNDIRGRHVTREHVMEAIMTAETGAVTEGNAGAGTGTQCLGFKGGIGTSSRVMPESSGGYTLGVLTQTNFGGILQIDGVPVGLELNRHRFRGLENEAIEDGSCMVVVITDAPLSVNDLRRLALRASFGIARAGGIASHGSGDYIIAISTAGENRVSYSSRQLVEERKIYRSDRLDLLFQAAIEATEEAIINSLFAARTVRSSKGTIRSEALPVNEVLEIMKRYNRLNAEVKK